MVSMLAQLLHIFGTQKLKDAVAKVWKDSFNPGGIMTGADANHKHDEVTVNQAQERQERYAAHNCPDIFDMLLALPYVLVSPETLRAAKDNAETAERSPVRDKIDASLFVTRDGDLDAARSLYERLAASGAGKVSLYFYKRGKLGRAEARRETQRSFVNQMDFRTRD